jgi:hypothetical protein
VSDALHLLALVVALLSIPTVAGMTAWALAGGDGTPDHPVLGVLGALVALGSVYVAVTCWTAYWGLAEWRWWLMFVSPAAALLGLVLASSGRRADDGPLDRVVGLVTPLVLAGPALLLWGAGVAPV